jgi:hypothetical protein
MKAFGRAILLKIRTPRGGTLSRRGIDYLPASLYNYGWESPPHYKVPAIRYALPPLLHNTALQSRSAVTLQQQHKGD